MKQHNNPNQQKSNPNEKNLFISQIDPKHLKEHILEQAESNHKSWQEFQNKADHIDDDQLEKNRKNWLEFAKNNKNLFRDKS